MNLHIGVRFWMVQGAGTYFLLVMTILEGDRQDCAMGCVGGGGRGETLQRGIDMRKRHLRCV